MTESEVENIARLSFRNRARVSAAARWQLARHYNLLTEQQTALLVRSGDIVEIRR